MHSFRLVRRFMRIQLFLRKGPHLYVENSYIFHSDNVPTHCSMIVTDFFCPTRNETHRSATVFVRFGSLKLFLVFKLKNPRREMRQESVKDH